MGFMLENVIKSFNSKIQNWIHQIVVNINNEIEVAEISVTGCTLSLRAQRQLVLKIRLI